LHLDLSHLTVTRASNVVLT